MWCGEQNTPKKERNMRPLRRCLLGESKGDMIGAWIRRVNDDKEKQPDSRYF